MRHATAQPETALYRAFERNPQSVPEARAQIRQWLGDDHLLTYAASLLVSELVTNAVKHALTPEEAFLIGRDPKSIGWVLLEMVNFTHEMASIRVTDPGHPTKAPRFRYQQKAGGDTLSEITMNGIKVDKPKIPSESGRGLALVRRISGHHCGSYPETETGHRVVWAFLSWKHVQSITWDIPDEDMLYLLAI